MIESLYRQRLAERQAALASKERTHAAYGWTRVAVFLAGVAIPVIGGLAWVNWIAVPAGAFLVLIVAHARLLNARDRAKSAVAFYVRGLERVTHQWIGRGRDGLDVLKRILNTAPEQHPYAIDLDLFGRGSLFELLATVRTHAGEEALGHWLVSTAPPDVIKARQEAVRELAPLLDLRERVAVLGEELRVAVHAGLLRQWAATPVTLTGTSTRVFLFAVAASTSAAVYWWIRTGEGALVLAALTTVQLAVAGYFKPAVSGVINAVDEPAHDLHLFAELVAEVEQQKFESAHLRALQSRIASTGRTASAEIRTLSRLVEMLHARNNVMFVIPSGIMMWGTQWAFAIEAWRSRAGVRIPVWLDVVGEFEALLALSAFTAEHPGHTFPVLVAPSAGPEGPASSYGSARLEGVDVAHPALGPEAVANSVRLHAGPEGPASENHTVPALLVVSGSNMSGKSTWLRAIGSNLVLANMGAPVRATAFRMSPLSIGASIRTVDSLADGRSRFMAEILRLKAIVDEASARNGALLFLLDEILSGTNSHDRRVGAEALLNSLVRAGAIGLITTHDLALGEIAERLPGRAGNVHFEDQFLEGNLSFDYKLKPGIVQTSNALALMRSIGIDV